MTFRASTTLMIQGTTSDAGKSVMVAGLCRSLLRRKIHVAPFKPQNMALNSAVTPEGGEIGRAQALQAQAAGVAAHVDMNPVLLKPNSDTGAQVIIHGKALSDMDACGFHDYKKTAMSAVLESHKRLASSYDAVVVEGAGSPAEINLRANDIANMGFAEAVDCPVVIVADIDRGGVFAHLVGTLELLSASEQSRVVGFIINRFRGDIALLQPGVDWLEKKTGKPVLGVIPYLQGLHLAAEDAISSEQISDANKQAFKVIVPVLPRISNHTDFDVLRMHPDVDLQFIGPDSAIPPADLIVLPGSKNVRQDCQWLKSQGWDKAIDKHLRYGGKLLGICGGLQMLGTTLSDPLGVEGAPGEVEGLALLDFETRLAQAKQLRQVSGQFCIDGAAVTGYEIHAGVSKGPALASPAIELSGSLSDGVLSDDSQIMGTYLHGLFDLPEACASLLHWAGLNNADGLDYHQQQEGAIDRLADALEQYMDLDALFSKVFSKEAL